MADLAVLERFEISGYRSCVDMYIDLQPDLSVLIGPNGSGKTNILSAIQLLRSLTSDDHPRRHVEGTATESQIRATFRVNEKKAVLTAKMQLLTDENNADEIFGSDQSWYAPDFTGNRSRIKAPLALGLILDNERTSRFDQYWEYMTLRRYKFEYDEVNMRAAVPNEFQNALVLIARHLLDLKYYSASQFTNPSLCPVSFEIEQEEGIYRRGVRLRGHAGFLYDLYEAQKSPKYQHFFSVIGPDGIGLIDELDFNEIQTSSIEYHIRSGGVVHQRKREKKLVIPQFKIGGNQLSPNQLSEGTFKTITLLFYLMTGQSSALLIEEPEVCVHHGLLTSIVELIKTYSSEKQIVVSTHSDFVLDQIEPRHVYKVNRSGNQGTTVTQIAKTMSSQELEALKKYLETEGNLGEYWRHGGLD